ncbi:hypothetical protein NKH89_09920 [Mesorhizobium sp. M0923]|uniref:hypothetical protein n=1 Tax=Mesorhizobium sp. M0923 TaxID=2957028 RepID=UPI00333BAF5B
MVGYAVLYGDNIQAWLMRFSLLGEGLWFSPITRLHLLYFGGLLVLGGYCSFRLFCPSEVRRFETPNEFIRYVRDGGDLGQAKAAYDAIRPFVPAGSQGAPLFGVYRVIVLAQGLGVLGGDSEWQSTLIPPVPIGVLNVLAAYYTLLDRSRPILSLATITLYSLGGLALIAPSIEVGLMVLRHVIFGAG